MDSADLRDSLWHDVPDSAIVRWRTIFDASTEGIDVSGSCPVCGATSLHRYFNLHKKSQQTSMGREWAGPGSEWRWCSQCKSYEHTSGLVPAWWTSPLHVAESELRHDPDAIEAVRARR